MEKKAYIVLYTAENEERIQQGVWQDAYEKLEDAVNAIIEDNQDIYDDVEMEVETVLSMTEELVNTRVWDETDGDVTRTWEIKEIIIH